MSFKLKLVAGVAAAVVSFGAGAASESWGTHDPFESSSSFVTGLFEDSYTFSLAAGSTYSLTSTVKLSQNAPAISNAVYSLWNADTHVQVGGDWSFGAAANTVSGLAAGNYLYFVTGKSGTPFGPSSSSYDIKSSISAVSAVPEPETYAMMLAGLGAVGFMARRRRSN